MIISVIGPDWPEGHSVMMNLVDGLAMIGEGLGLSDAGADRFAAVALHVLVAAVGVWGVFMASTAVAIR